MKFGANKTPVQIIKEGAFGGTCFRDIYSGINGKWNRKSWKEFDQLKDIDHRFYCSNFYDVSVNKYCVKCGISLRFWENKGCINMIDPYGCFQWYFKYWLDRRLGEIISRFRGKLVKVIKDANSKFDDYSTSPKIRKILLHWGYELTEKFFLLT